MKKLMVAAAAAAMTAGAFADACSDISYTEAGGHCLVYDLTIKAKTLGPKLFKCGKDYADEYVVYLDNYTRTLRGYLWQCEDTCWESGDEIRIVVWDAKDKAAVIPLPYAVEGDKAVQYPNTTDFEWLGRYGKKATKVAAEWMFEADGSEFACAGVNGSMIKDKYNLGQGMLKSISGYFAGLLDVSVYTIKGHCGDKTEIDPLYTTLCFPFEDWCCEAESADVVPATGTWKITYNDKLSKSNKSMLSIVPAYALERED